ncbi:NAD(P)-binding protein [Gautieria morchelliformis]|nr:NAD(P)-binding protein [Gautieria morchelliformis]
MDTQWVSIFAAATLLGLYLLHVNRALLSTPHEVHTITPNRFDQATIIANYERLLKDPISVDLPPKTGRRYIVVGGAGFLAGWIVVQLISRGEDPRRIRIVDIRPPTRQDLTTGPGSKAAFHQTDVSNADAVLAAFSAPWPDADDSDIPVTVFNSGNVLLPTAANIRFWERVESLLPFSDHVNVKGSRNVIAACRAIGATILVYTSSASVTTQRTRFWLWPWQRSPKYFVQVLDDDAPLPPRHNSYFANYAVSKAKAERLVREADNTLLPCGGFFRTGCIRPGNGVFGPGGDVLAGAYLVRQQNYTWVRNIIQSFIYVENCSLAHLLYEQRLLEMGANTSSGTPDIGGQAFNVSDPNPPIAFGDIYTALTTLTINTKFQDLPPVLMLMFAHVIEAYYLLRFSHPFISWIFPQLKGEILLLQPSLFSLSQIHLIFDDSRARKSPKEGGLGYKAPFTSLDGLCKLVIEWEKEGKREEEILAVGSRINGFGQESGWRK